MYYHFKIRLFFFIEFSSKTFLSFIIYVDFYEMITIFGVTFLFLMRSNRTWVSNASSIEKKNIKRKQCWRSFSLLSKYYAQNKIFHFISTHLRNCSYLVIRNGKRLIKHQGKFIQSNLCCYKDQYAQKWKGSRFQSAKIRVHCVFHALVPILLVFDHRCSKSMGIGLPSVTVK